MFRKTLTLFCLLLLVLLGIWYAQPSEVSGDESLASEIPQEFVLFTMPKTGTHLMRPLLEYLTDKYSVSYWSSEVKCPRSYLYDKKGIELLLTLPDAIQPYWLHAPITKDCFVSALNALEHNDDFLVTHAPLFPCDGKSLERAQNPCLLFSPGSARLGHFGH